MLQVTFNSQQNKHRVRHAGFTLETPCRYAEHRTAQAKPQDNATYSCCSMHLACPPIPMHLKRRALLTVAAPTCEHESLPHVSWPKGAGKRRECCRKMLFTFLLTSLPSTSCASHWLSTLPPSDRGGCSGCQHSGSARRLPQARGLHEPRQPDRHAHRGQAAGKRGQASGGYLIGSSRRT